MLDEGVGGQLLTKAVGNETVFREAEVEKGHDGGVGVWGELFLLFGEVGSADLEEARSVPLAWWLSQGLEGFEEGCGRRHEVECVQSQ